MNHLVVPEGTEVLRLDNAGLQLYRIRDIEFSDLLMNASGMAEIQGSGQAPLVQLPTHMFSDLGDLMAKAFQMAMVDDEFTIVHDEISYRGSRVDNVNKQDGVTVNLRRMHHRVPRMAELNLPVTMMRALGYMANKDKGRGEGLILVAGSTGSGKTTTISSVLQEYLIKYGGVARTIEDPPEYPLEGSYPPYGRCLQTRVIKKDFITPLEKILRQAPRYILFGEIRDRASATELLRAASTGHIVLSTIHASSITEALNMLVQLVAERQGRDFANSLIATSLAAILHQRLSTTRLSDMSVERIPIVKSLFIPSAEVGFNSMIREGKFHLLASTIDEQNAKIMAGNNPFPMDRRR